MAKHERSASQDAMLKHPDTKRAKEIDADPPYEQLRSLCNEQSAEPAPRRILHWFRSKDLRCEDNVALHNASENAKGSKDGYLVTCYLFSPKDMEWHGTSPARSDLLLRSLKILQKQLEDDFQIPLVPITASGRKDKIGQILDFIKQNDISHVYANFEYEIDELRRDINLFHRLQEEKLDVSFQLFHDQTIVEPGTLRTGGGGPHQVFTPYHKAWLAEVGKNPDLLTTVHQPAPNGKQASTDLKQLFGKPVPNLPESKQYATEDEQQRLRKLWPAGHEVAMERLDNFLKKKAKTYEEKRSNAAADNSSRLSPYFASGLLSVREALSAASRANDGKAFDSSGDAGIASWVREIVFREFYRHVLVFKPHNAMNLPQNLKFEFVEWEDDPDGWQKWCDGTLGVPFVDAGMRQLRHEAWMHNRLRMNTASYLRTNLLIDYRKGERFFAENLVDWDLSNNTQGWEPSWTVFNPVSQAEKNDPEGKYIRKWVPELKNVEGKAVFDPFHRLDKKEFEKLGYPEPHVEFQASKQRCLQRYKADMTDVKP